MNERARHHAVAFIEAFTTAQMPLFAAASGIEPVSPGQLLDLRDMVMSEGAWVRDHRAEWASADRRPWDHYRMLLLELERRLTELIDAAWDLIAAQAAGDEAAAQAAMEASGAAASKGGAAAQGLLDVQQALGSSSKPN